MASISARRSRLPSSPQPSPDPADLLDAAEERAAIVKHDAGLSCAEAEAAALATVECSEAACELRARWGRHHDRG